jgi:hypothetical protein
MVARYRLVEPMYLKADDHLEAWMHSAGEEILFSGTPHRNMVALNAEAVAAKALVTPLTGIAKDVLPRRGDPP